jgi:hypothetical protein
VKVTNIVLSTIYLLVYSCCSHLEHRASVNRFVSLQFLNFRQSVGLLGQGISRLKAATYTEQHKPRILVFERAKTVHALDPEMLLRI